MVDRFSQLSRRTSRRRPAGTPDKHARWAAPQRFSTQARPGPGLLDRCAILGQPPRRAGRPPSKWGRG